LDNISDNLALMCNNDVGGIIVAHPDNHLKVFRNQLENDKRTIQ